MQKTHKASKKTGSKLLVLMSAVLLAINLFPALLFAAPPGTAEIYIGEPLEGYPAEGYEAGDVFTIPVMLADNPGFSGINLELTFDTDVVTFVPVGNLGLDYSLTEVLLTTNNMTTVTGAADGYVVGAGFDLSHVGTDINIMENGILYTASFQVTEDAVPGDYSINLDLRQGQALNFVNSNSQPIPYNITSFDFTVKSTVEPPEPEPAVVSLATVDNVEPGDSFSMPVMISNNPGFAGAIFKLGFDSDVLTLDGFTTGDVMAGFIEYDLADAKIEYIGDNVANGDGFLFYADFTVSDDAANGTYTITISLYGDDPLSFVDEDLQALDIDLYGGSVIVFKTVAPPEGTTIIVGEASGYPGEQVTVPVSIVDNPGFASALFNFKYDTTLMTLVGLVPSDDIPAVTLVTPLPPEQDRVSIVSNANITGDIKLFDLVFEIADGAYACDSIVAMGVFNPSEHNFVNAAQEDVEVSFEAGKVTILEGENELVIPDDLDFPAFDFETTWTRVYNGEPQAIAVTVTAAGGVGAVTIYYDGSTTAPTVVGDYEVTVTVTGVPGYKPINDPVFLGNLSIIKAPAPDIEWPTASAITYGQTLADVTLSGGSTAYGSFAWDDNIDLDVVLDAGTYFFLVIFTPNADTAANYEAIAPVAHDVEVVVNKAAAPTVTVWPTAATIRQGQPLSESALTPASNEYGSFAWTNGAYVPSAPGGDFEVTFTPSADTLKNYEAIDVTTMDIHVTVVIGGDIDGSGSVSALDAMLILQHATGLITLTGDAFIAADLDGDGYITSGDAIMAARKALGLD